MVHGFATRGNVLLNLCKYALFTLFIKSIAAETKRIKFGLVYFGFHGISRWKCQ